MSNAAFLRRKAILERYGVSNSTLYAWIQAKKFPAPIKLVEGGAASAWLVSEIERFDAERIEAQRKVARFDRNQRESCMTNFNATSAGKA